MQDKIFAKNTRLFYFNLSCGCVQYFRPRSSYGDVAHTAHFSVQDLNADFWLLSDPLWVCPRFWLFFMRVNLRSAVKSVVASWNAAYFHCTHIKKLYWNFRQ